MIWTRADDLQHDKYRPAGAMRLAAALDAEGHPCAWFMRIAGSELVLEGIHVPYAIPQLREEHVEVESAVPTGAWRSVGASQNAFAIECFVDELAHAAGRDPFEYRRRLLQDAPRERALLELVAEKAGWGRPLPAGHGRGIARYRSFGSSVAQVAEVAVVHDTIKVERVVCAIDCGIAVNPDPVIGATPYKNLFLNTGHGTLGWTMACGSGKVLADIVSGRKAEIDLSGLTLARFAPRDRG